MLEPLSSRSLAEKYFIMVSCSEVRAVMLLYRDLIDELSSEFPLGQPITGEQKQKDFIKLYGNILRLKNILSAFDQFAGHELLPERDFQDYQSVYLDLYQAYRPKTEKHQR